MRTSEDLHPTTLAESRNGRPPKEAPQRRYEGATPPSEPVYTEVRTLAPRGVYRGYAIRRDLVCGSRGHPRRLSSYKSLPFGFASYGDEDFSSSMSLFQIPDGLRGLAQRVGPVDDRRDLAGLDELLEDEQVLLVLRRNERAQLLAHEGGQHEHSDLTIRAFDPPITPSAPTITRAPRG